MSSGGRLGGSATAAALELRLHEVPPNVNWPELASACQDLWHATGGGPAQVTPVPTQGRPLPQPLPRADPSTEAFELFHQSPEEDANPDPPPAQAFDDEALENLPEADALRDPLWGVEVRWEGVLGRVVAVMRGMSSGDCYYSVDFGDDDPADLTEYEVRAALTAVGAYPDD